MDNVETLLPALRKAARDLVDQRSLRDLEQTLESIVRAAVQTVPGADAGGISITENDTIASRAPTNSTIAKLDRLQSELREGPCITALEDVPTSGTVLAGDLAGQGAEAWPHFAPLAVEAGYRAILSTSISVDRGTRAALNLYASEPDAFDDEGRTTAGLFGAQAALLLYGNQQASHLQRAIESRDVIGQAKGILMERFTVDDEEAFEMLVRSSQDTNMKLADVARWLQSEATERRRQRRQVVPDPETSI